MYTRLIKLIIIKIQFTSYHYKGPEFQRDLIVHFVFAILFTGRTLTLLTIQMTIPTFKLILQLLVTPLILIKSIYMHYLQAIYYNTFFTAHYDT